MAQSFILSAMYCDADHMSGRLENRGGLLRCRTYILYKGLTSHRTWYAWWHPCQDTADDLVHDVIQCMQCEDTWHRKLLCVMNAISVRQRAVQKEFTRLTDNQKDTFCKMTGEICRANENLCSTRPDVCPVWGTVHPMLYRRDKKIRWYCGSCSFKLAYVSHTITFSLKIARDVFLDTLNMVSIRKNVACFQQQYFAWSN